MNQLCHLYVLFCCIPIILQAQPDESITPANIEQIIELLMEQGDLEDADFTTMLDRLERMHAHPLDLNHCTSAELAELPFLDPLQCAAIVLHRERTGPFITPLELQGLGELELPEIQLLLPFIQVNRNRDARQLRWVGIQDDGYVEGFVRFQRILEEQRGYRVGQLNAYPGSPYRVLSRLRFRYLDAISIGITAEKDPGEKVFGAGQAQGFDFYSAHASIAKQGLLDALIIGDYQAQFGQGLVVWSGMAFGKSGDLLTAKRNARGVLPYVSADENNFLRGAALRMRWRMLESTTFLSSLAKDASMADSISPDGLSVFTAFRTQGIHATEAQLAGKDAVRQNSIGQNLAWSNAKFQIGWTAVRMTHNALFQPPDRPYRMHDALPASFFVTGLHYRYLWGSSLWFGEWAVRSGRKQAMLHGVLWSLGRSTEVSLLYRKYDVGFHHPLSNAFGEASQVNNEEGIYLATTMRFNRSWKLRAYADLFRFPWLRFRVDMPSAGREYWTQLDYRPSKRTEAYLRFRFEEKQQNFTTEDQVTNLIETIKRQDLRFHVAYQLSDQLSLRNRIDLVWVHLPGGMDEGGLLLYQDLIWKPSWPARYQLKLRYAMFDTDGFASRIYAYEHDLRYAFSIPAFSGRGVRCYALFSYRFSDWGKLSLRIAQTYYSNRTQIGSGLNTIDGSVITDVRMQVGFKL